MTTVREQKKEILRNRIKEEIEEHGNMNRTAIAHGFNPGAFPWVMENNGFSPTLWEIFELEGPPPRGRFCTEDPTGFFREMLGWICEVMGWTRPQAMSYMISLMVMEIISEELGESQ